MNPLLLWAILSATVIAALRIANRKWGDWTIACTIRDHSTCANHLSCPCRCHDKAIMEAMTNDN